MMKKCSFCKVDKSLTDFYKNRSQEDGLQHRCISCLKANFLQWKIENPEAYRKRTVASNRKREEDGSRRNWHLKRMFGITQTDYNALLSRQDEGCGICKSKFLATKRSFNVDHDHVTKEVRGLLCHRCNMGIGYFLDSIGLLQNAIQYLSKVKVNV